MSKPTTSTEKQNEAQGICIDEDIYLVEQVQRDIYRLHYEAALSEDPVPINPQVDTINNSLASGDGVAISDLIKYKHVFLGFHGNEQNTQKLEKLFENNSLNSKVWKTGDGNSAAEYSYQRDKMTKDDELRQLKTIYGFANMEEARNNTICLKNTDDYIGCKKYVVNFCESVSRIFVDDFGGKAFGCIDATMDNDNFKQGMILKNIDNSKIDEKQRKLIGNLIEACLKALQAKEYDASEKKKFGMLRSFSSSTNYLKLMAEMKIQTDLDNLDASATGTGDHIYGSNSNDGSKAQLQAVGDEAQVIDERGAVVSKTPMVGFAGAEPGSSDTCTIVTETQRGGARGRHRPRKRKLSYENDNDNNNNNNNNSLEIEDEISDDDIDYADDDEPPLKRQRLMLNNSGDTSTTTAAATATAILIDENEKKENDNEIEMIKKVSNNKEFMDNNVMFKGVSVAHNLTDGQVIALLNAPRMNDRMNEMCTLMYPLNAPGSTGTVADNSSNDGNGKTGLQFFEFKVINTKNSVTNMTKKENKKYIDASTRITDMSSRDAQLQISGIHTSVGAHGSNRKVGDHGINRDNNHHNNKENIRENIGENRENISNENNDGNINSGTVNVSGTNNNLSGFMGMDGGAKKAKDEKKD